VNKPKLSVEDFYHQFHGLNHHNDPGDYVKPEWHTKNPKLEARHKGFDLKAYRNSKRKKPVLLTKSKDAMRLELIKRKAK
jgi:hypothetical protein